MAATPHDMRLTSLTVRDVMSPGVLACPPATPLRTAAGMMAVHDVHAVVLIGASDQPPTILTDLGLLAAYEKIDAARAADAASRPATVAPGDPLLAATTAMAERDQSHALVIEPGSPVPAGVLSTLDIASALAGRDAGAVRMVHPRAARPAISGSRLDRVTAAEAMHLGVFACPMDATLREIATIMVDRRIHCVGVLESREPAGWEFISDHSLAHAAARGGSARAADLAGNALWIDGGATLDEAAAVMVGNGVSHLLVRGDHEVPVGVLSTLDVLRVLAGD
jgi:CBS domain-containing protein